MTLVKEFHVTTVLHNALHIVITVTLRFQWFHAGSQVVIITTKTRVSLPDVDFHQVSISVGELELLPPAWVRAGVNDLGFFGVRADGHLLDQIREDKFN